MARAVIGAVLLAASALAAAQETVSGADDGSSWSLQWENDLFAKDRSDRYYTNGLRIVKARPASLLSKPADDSFTGRHGARTGRWLCGFVACDPEFSKVAVDTHGGQNMYTPQNLVRSSADPYDRPYGGWLYLGYRTRLADLPDAQDDATRQQTLDISVGVVGPSAGAGAVQREWHRLIGAVDPQGWAHQLRDEPALQLVYTRAWRRPLGPLADMLPHLRLSVGNVLTLAAVGTQLRVGPNLDGFGHFDPMQSIVPNLSRRGGSPYYAFFATEVRLVARNIFIDGNTFRDPPAPDFITRRPGVVDATLGFSVRLSDRWRLTYGHTWRSPEFTQDRPPPAGGPRPAIQRYGVIQIQRDA